MPNDNKLFINHISLFIMRRSVAVLFFLLLATLHAAYNPQLMLTLTADLINKQISTNLGQYITQGINTADIADVDIEKKISGINVKFYLTKIKQKVDINFKGNVLTVKDKHNFVINSKNMNITLDGQLDLKIGVLKKQKGPLKVIITKLEVDTALRVEQSTCPKSIGFNIRVTDIFTDFKDVSIKIEGKSFDNKVIAQIEKYLLPRLPNLINNMGQKTINPLIESKTCSRIEEEVPIKDSTYILTINTTKIPEFDENLKYFGVPIDITFQNVKTNETNDDIEKDGLPSSTIYHKTSDSTLSLSSNFLDMILWIVEDSDYLQLTVTNAMLGDSPPILLNTTNLSILMPNLAKRWPNKEVFLLIEPSAKFEHLLIRSGRLVSVLSLSVKFVVNVTGKISDVNECIEKGNCVVACNLNMTLPLSLSMSITSLKMYRALIHTLSFYDIQFIEQPLIDINLQSLKDIINAIVGSMLPSINSGLQGGQTLPEKVIELMAKFGAKQIKSQIFQDFMAVGLNFDV